MDLFLLATSYAPGHNFWRGRPLEWWMRGILKAIELNAIPVAGAVLVFWMSSRGRRWMHWIVGWSLVLLMLWIALPSMSYRDSDMPTAIGWRWVLEFDLG
jgi:hypothetical protein